MRPEYQGVPRAAEGFQSPSGPKAGCDQRTSSAGAASTTFQSPSGPKAGCDTQHRDFIKPHIKVSIPIRPEGRMRHDIVVAVLRPPNVSIPIRPEGRMRHGTQDAGIAILTVSIPIRPEGRMRLRPRSWPTSGGCFNPHPARRPDATGRSFHVRPRGRRFNPHPARRPDATALTAA